MSMADRDGFIWYDGKLVPGVQRQLTSHHSLHYGCGIEGCAPTRPSRDCIFSWPTTRAPVQLGPHLHDENPLRTRRAR